MRLYGKVPVIERLKINPKSIRKIYIQEGNTEAGYICKKAQKWKIPILRVPRTKISKMTRNRNAQGVIADIEGFPYEDYTDILAAAVKRKEVLLFLDEVTDPQNLGAIMRSLACLGRFSIILPTHGSVAVTEAVLRVAAGGDNYVKVAQVKNLSQAIKKAKDQGFWIAGTVVKGGDPIEKVTFPYPLGIVIGSEQKGIRDVVRKNLDVQVTISMAQARMSMNVAHATTIFCYEITKQKNSKKKPD